MAGLPSAEPAASRRHPVKLRTVVRAATVSAGLPAAFCGGYLGVLTLAGKRHRPSTATDRSVRFAFVVPAHNEAFGISETIASLRAVDYPRHCFRVIVIADNCSDDTAAVARTAGAQVIERHDDARRSKGFALSDVLPEVLRDRSIDAVVVIDADTIVSSNILLLAAGRIADGERALQVRYGVRNPDDSWRTQLLAIAFACFHDVRSAGREELRLSCGLRGNGMVFTREALERAPHRAASLVEDLEHGLDLSDVGIRVAYVGGASVLAEMPKDAAASRSQRDRWERGRASFRGRARAHLRAGMLHRDRVALDLGMDVLIPPLGTVAALSVLSGAMAAGSSLARRRIDPSAITAAVALGGLGIHVAAGWRASGTGVKGFTALVQVPRYLWWKLSTNHDAPRPESSGGQPVEPSTWVRTTRNHEAAVDDSRTDSGLIDGSPMNIPSAEEECAS